VTEWTRIVTMTRTWRMKTMRACRLSPASLQGRRCPSSGPQSNSSPTPRVRRMTYHQNLLIQDRLLLCCNNPFLSSSWFLEDPPSLPWRGGWPPPLYNQTPRPTAQLKPVPYYLSFLPPAQTTAVWGWKPASQACRVTGTNIPGSLTVVFPNWVFYTHIRSPKWLVGSILGNVGGKNPGGVRLTRVN